MVLLLSVVLLSSVTIQGWPFTHFRAHLFLWNQTNRITTKQEPNITEEVTTYEMMVTTEAYSDDDDDDDVKEEQVEELLLDEPSTLRSLLSHRQGAIGKSKKGKGRGRRRTVTPVTWMAATPWTEIHNRRRTREIKSSEPWNTTETPTWNETTATEEDTTITSILTTISTTPCPDTTISHVDFTSTNDTITVIWSSSTSNDSSRFEVRINNGNWTNATETSFTWNGLESCSKYNISVRPVSSCGNNDTTPISVIVQTKGDPGKITDVKIIQEHFGLTVRMTWTSLKGLCASNITSYYISWKSADGKMDGKMSEGNTEQESFVLPHYYSTYEICITAALNNGTILNSTMNCNNFNTSVGKPGEPRDVTVVPKSRSVDVFWDVPNEVNGPIDYYLVSFLKNITRISNNSITFEGLCPKTKYSVHVAAVNIYNGTIPLSSANVSTDFITENERPPPIRNLTVTDLYCNVSMYVAWYRPDPLCEDFTENYYVTVLNANNKTIYKQDVTDTVDIVNENLTYFTSYNFCVQAISKGRNDSSELISEKQCVTAETCVGEPDHVKLTGFSKTSRSIALAWTRPINPNGPIDYYEVEYYNCNSNETQINHTSSQNYTLEDLDPCTMYMINIRAVNLKENQTLKSQPEATNIATDNEAPTVTVEASPVNSSVLNINWTADVHPYCKIGNFTIKLTSLDNAKLNRTLSTPNSYQLITDLNPYTGYNVCVMPCLHDTLEECLQVTSSKVQGNCTDVATPEAEEAPFPCDVRLINCSSFACSVSWSMPEVQYGPNITYNVHIQDEQESLISQKSVTPKSYKIKESAELENLQPYTRYKAVVQVKMNHKRQNNTSAVERTAPTVPDDSFGLKVFCNDKKKKAEISPPKRITGKLESFNLSYEGVRPKHEHQWNQMKIKPEATEYPLTLKPQYFYSFSLTAKNENVSEWSASVVANCSVPAIAPEKPNLTDSLFIDSIVFKNPNQIEVSFYRQLFSEENGDITNYTIILFEEQESKADLSNIDAVWDDVISGTIRPYQVTPNYWNPFDNSSVNNEMCCTTISDLVVKCILGCKKSCPLNEPCNGHLRPNTNYRMVVRIYTDGGYTDSDEIPLSTAPEENTGAAVTLGICLTLLVLIAAAIGYIHYRHKELKFFLSFRPMKMESETQTPQDGVIFENKARTRMVKLSDFEAHLQKLNKDMRLKFSEEYEELKSMSPSHSTNIAQLPENRSKNRWVNILPFDYCRVKLLPVADDTGSSDYINASYIPGFNSQREYIATQGPLPGTKDDFWRMVWEQSCCMIVMVTQLMERGKVKCEQYWPDDREVHYYGDLSVQMTSESILSGFTIRIFDLHLGTNKLIVKQMHFTKWPDFGCPETTGLLINFVRAVREHMPHSVTGPIVVHCSAGVGRTGTFIAVDCLMQHVHFHDTIDIYGKVLEMRQYRANMVQTEDQYVYIHECVRDILNASERQNNGESIYANFGSLDRDSKM